jgi:hypothetical protein
MFGEGEEGRLIEDATTLGKANLPILFASPRSVTWTMPNGTGDGLQTSAAKDGLWRIAPGPRRGVPDR